MEKRQNSYIIHWILTLVTVVVTSIIVSCSGNPAVDRQLAAAENMMEERPDSALSVLNGIDTELVTSEAEKARYALLMSQALDKNYIDTTTFDVLQPAIDYYIDKDKGMPDEKLKTYYYKGRIFMNQGNNDYAMASFMNGGELSGITDSISLARLLVAKSIMFYRQYKPSGIVDCSLSASRIYKSLGQPEAEFDCLLKTLNALWILKDKHLADSVLSVCRDLTVKNPEFKGDYEYTNLAYNITFGSNDDIQKSLSDLEAGNMSLSTSYMLDIANAYIKIEDYKGAQHIIEKVSQSISPVDSLKFLVIKSYVCEKNNDYKEALLSLKEYQVKVEENFNELFNSDLLFVEQRHELEMSSILALQGRDRIILISLIGLLLVSIITIIVFFRFKLVKADNRLKEQKNKQLQLEKEQQKLTEENIRLQLSEMEAECENLKALFQTDAEIPVQVSEAIKSRIGILNGLLAEKISGNVAYRKQYEEWVEQIVSDRQAFMDSTRLAFKVSHPKFIEYLESHDLTEAEINYVCLYAIGLRGKEVGEYIQLRRHYNVSSEIRKKLGLDEHQTNIGIYVRKLMSTF